MVGDEAGFGQLTREADVDTGAWAVSGVGAWGTVACLVPAVFSDYARVFHPARYDEDEVRWSDVAAANGRVAHPAMQWAAITGHWRYRHGGTSQTGVWDQQPEEGSLTHRQVAELADVLVRYTTTPERCVFAVWEGYGDVWPRWGGPVLPMPHRDMVLFTGPLSAARTSFTFDPDMPWYRSPSLWWPEDRAWCVATDVDLSSSYLGASQACVDALLDDAGLEVMRVTANQSIGEDADHINPAPEGDPYS